MLLNILITLSSAYIALSYDQCATQGPCRCVFPNNEAIDVSTVGSRDFPRFYQIAYQNGCSQEELYSYNPCFSFDSVKHTRDVAKGRKPCVGAAACIRTPGKPNGEFPEEYMIGLQSSAAFYTNEDKSVYIKYTVPTVPDRNLVVNLICDKTSQENKLEMFFCNASASPDIVMNLTSKCACLNGCSSAIPLPSPPGLSVGSKILIAFFSILLAYIIVGVCWNYCNGSKGAELIPNVEFWNDLPTLIMEGVSFTCSCCGRQRSYGDI